MARLEDVKQGCSVRGVVGAQVVSVVSVQWHGPDFMNVVYRTDSGKLDEVMLTRQDEARIGLAGDSKWSFEGDPAYLRLVSEAYRIHLAHLFDPYLAVRTSAIEPLPHQISAVYQEMLPKMPLRYVLADDPGAGKTIMCGLLVKEMIARGDLKRCLIVCPGNLVEQWQDELYRKFGLRFAILTNDLLEASVTRNAFAENDLLIARLDKLSRNDDVRASLAKTAWDLVVVDEAHKMSATVFGGEVRYTKRFLLGRLLGDITENLLLLTATPHDGKPEDFQLFMSLIDRDRFEGAHHARQKAKKRASRQGTPALGTAEGLGGSDIDVSDCMRRLVKEELLRFDGRPLFPERRASTVTYTLSPAEAALYDAVTEYVTGEFNRADRLDGKRRSSVGFALTILQRRLASSPEAIYQSLRRRRERLEQRLADASSRANGTASFSRVFQGFDEDFDEDDLTPEELEGMEDDVMDSASASATSAELGAEIATLRALERRANDVRLSGADRKWEELSRLLQDNAQMFSEDGRREKLIIFTEHRDTLEYLATKIRQLLGSHDAVLTIKGGMPRDERRRAEEMFKQDKAVRVLVATDAAGEGINLQRAHLMVNYDLPWNPNRIEQRFGRIHRIGQTEVCHLWNLVAKETREGQVFDRLFQKLDEERAALGGRVFDVLGRVTFEDKPLRDLLVEAIRYGDDPQVRNRLNEVVDSSLDVGALRTLLEEYALTDDVMDVREVMRIREDMERMEARRLEPHFIEAFFLEAMRRLGGRVERREPGRYEVIEVPFAVRSRDMHTGKADPVLKSYERICFSKSDVTLEGAPTADLVCPGHPLLDATEDVIREQLGGALHRGAVLVDDNPAADVPRLLFYVESSVVDGMTNRDGTQRVVSREVHFVEMDYDGNVSDAGYAPYLDYRPPTERERAGLDGVAEELGWLSHDPEELARDYAIQHIVPEHVRKVTERIRAQNDKVARAVEKRLTAEIRYWDYRAAELADNEARGKVGARLNSAAAEKRANDLAERLENRRAQLKLQGQLSSRPPRVVGGALVVPACLLASQGSQDAGPDDMGADAAAKRRTGLAAMDAVMAIERELRFEPRDVSADKCGYDVESVVPEALRTRDGGPALRMIEVKGRQKGAATVTVSKNEILCALNCRESFILALVEVDGSTSRVTYLRNPEFRAPAFTENSVNFDIGRLIESADIELERTFSWQ